MNRPTVDSLAVTEYDWKGMLTVSTYIFIAKAYSG